MCPTTGATPGNGTVTIPNTIVQGSTIAFFCNQGFTLSGTVVMGNLVFVCFAPSPDDCLRCMSWPVRMLGRFILVFMPASFTSPLSRMQ